MSPRPTVVFATGIYPPDIGGPATYVARLSEALAKDGWPVRIVTYSDEIRGSVPDQAPSGARDLVSESHITRVSRRQTIMRRYRDFQAAVAQACNEGAATIVFAQDPLSSGLPASRVTSSHGSQACGASRVSQHRGA